MTRFKSLFILLLLLAGNHCIRAGVIPGLFGTGLGANGSLLALGAVDPHWQLVIDSNSPAPTTYVVNNNGFPIPPWLAQGPYSQWIAPQADESTGNPAAQYHYRTTFDLTGYDPATVQLRMVAASDDRVSDVLLNGVSTHISFPSGFTSSDTRFLATGFVAGTNSLEFIVANNLDGPTGFRCELQATSYPPGTLPELKAEMQGNNVLIYWPDTLLPVQFETSTNLAANSWTTVVQTPAAVNGRMSMAYSLNLNPRFFRLRGMAGGPPIPHVGVNPDDADIAQYARFAANGDCSDPGTDGCLLPDPLDGGNYNSFDASPSIDPQGGILSYHWEIFFPLSRSGAKYTAKGISGYFNPVLTIQPGSLPDLGPVLGSSTWRVRLTITSNAGPVPKTTVALFCFRYANSTTTLQMSTQCQSPAGGDCTVDNARPTNEPN